MYYLRRFDPWRNPLCTCPPKYSLAPYTGCSHKCLYCYATAYIGVRDSVAKKDFIPRLKRDLDRADPRLHVSMSNSSDPYPPVEARLGLTRETLRLLLSRGFKVLVITKSDLVARDVDLLVKGPASISITITTSDDYLASRVERGAPPPSRRMEALARLIEEKVPVSVRVDPVIPGLNDDPEALRSLVKELAYLGVRHVVTSTYKARWDNLARLSREFPDKAQTWRELYLVKGEKVRGYFYLPKSLRARLLRPVVEAAREYGLTYATCREGLKTRRYFNAPTCDGSHLIPLRKAQASRWGWSPL